MGKLPRTALLGAAIMLALPAAAQIYKSTDEQGNVVFSDKPPASGAKAETLDLPRTNTTPPPPVVAPLPRDSAGQVDAEAEAAPIAVNITSPADETTIPMGAGGNFTVTADVNGGSGDGQTLQLLMDGIAYSDPQQSGSWNLENVFRGAHDLVVQVLNQDGEIVATSEPVRVYVMRPSVN
ncbi:DUF4124 domain-containing protein [Pseudohalioglobus sediminis]|uniref:DUF4124 domain-containing protein n=1 Tax=Pseudohalioglobus sediminis TaxID=2606449 RepID=A0A5B0WTH7_9GAMM|nr:DUF4124 domain-containing protein [Pseudohalioglobus sediminis]KAA1190380.1 DUF4124 domain-containing protein [Pseudohalioglobus sediminis]